MLTQERLLSSSDDDYMSEDQLAFFRNRLLVLQKEISGALGGVHADDGDALHAADPVDRASMEEERAALLRDRERSIEILRGVDLALRRIDDGEYGYCEETGEPIGLARLLVHPTARLSIEAQNAREQQQRQFRRAA